MYSIKSFFSRSFSITFIVILLLIAFASFGFAAANTVDDSYAGDGSSTVSGWAVDVEFVVDSDGDITDIEEVDLVFSGQPDNPDQAWVILDGTQYSCTLAGAAATCAITPVVDVVTAATVEVVAVNAP